MFLIRKLLNRSSIMGISLFLLVGLCFCSRIWAEQSGDLNGDGNINSIDIGYMQRYLLDQIHDLPVADDIGAADMNSDRQINSLDYAVLKRILLGLVTPSPSPTPSTVTYDLVVAKDGSGNYNTVQAAINTAPNNSQKWFVIYIKNGVYREVITVPSTKTFLRLIGESVSGTILTYNNCSDTAGGTSASASVFLKANNFIAENVTFENSFDYDNSTLSNKQAVAAEPMADRQIFLNCRFTGHQDTLYVRNGRQYFKNCYIEGHTDFIFGDATAVFDQCEIHSLYKPGGCITAPSTLASNTYGLVFLNCLLTGDSQLNNSVYLGRPWHPSSSGTTVKSSAAFLYCNLGSYIKNDGWTSMSGVSPSTERFHEYKNTGPGAVLNTYRPQLSDYEATGYNIANIFKGSDNWDPTEIP
jgi:pectinesterase